MRLVEVYSVHRTGGFVGVAELLEYISGEGKSWRSDEDDASKKCAKKPHNMRFTSPGSIDEEKLAVALFVVEEGGEGE